MCRNCVRNSLYIFISTLGLDYSTVLGPTAKHARAKRSFRKLPYAWFIVMLSHMWLLSRLREDMTATLRLGAEVSSYQTVGKVPGYSSSQFLAKNTFQLVSSLCNFFSKFHVILKVLKCTLVSKMRVL